MRQKFLRYTDTHFGLLSFWSRWQFVRHVRKEQPKGIFITGDIANGIGSLLWTLEYFARHIACPIYFVLGNHDLHFSSIAKVKARVSALCDRYPTLVWMTEAGVVPLVSAKTALIGTEGFYDAENGNPAYLRLTLDWFLTREFRELPNMEARLAKFRALADESCLIIEKQLTAALDLGYKTIYLLTHYPPWPEATHDAGTIMEKFWLPYNANVRLGQTIERLMKGRKKRRLIVLAGHTHTSTHIQVSRNIECIVNDASYLHHVGNDLRMFI